MDLKELKRVCSEWNQSSEGFCGIVSATVSAGLYQRELAAEFEVAESTVSRWSRGIARPHLRMQRLIVAAIEKRIQRALKAQDRGYGGTSAPLAAKNR
jgi:transcriptional regulator with XRE-family HTH domain